MIKWSIIMASYQIILKSRAMTELFFVEMNAITYFNQNLTGSPQS